MLEILLCSMFTLLPDYLYRRYVQGKRIGHEITLYSSGSNCAGASSAA
jgi:hypothetical protein